MKISDILEHKKSRRAKVYNVKPRNPVAHAAQSVISGAGAHKDMKKAQKQGYEKHKKPAEVTEGLLDRSKRQQIIQFLAKKMDWEINYLELASDAELISWYKKVQAGKDPMKESGFGRDAYQRDYDSSVSGFGRRNREDDWDEGNTEPPNNFAIYINGKKWKVFPGQGTYADDHREMAQLRRLQDMCRKKTEQTGKKWEVSRTGEPATA